MKTILYFLCLSFLLLQGITFAQDYVPEKEGKMSGLSSTRESRDNSCDVQSMQNQEWRAFWLDAWNKGISNETQVKEAVEIAYSRGYNAIVVQVRRRGDAIYFPTYPNEEPRMPGLSPDFDALYTMIREAHAKQIEVHAWITTFLISTSTPPSSPFHVYHKHPEYLTENMAGEKNIAEGYYLDPGNPDALEWNARVIMDIVTHYDIDGLHFDYVRYPQQNSGYNPTAIQRYNTEFGLSGKPHYTDPNFSAWRRRQITDWIRKMYVQIMEKKPMLKVTAATFPSRTDAYENRFQDWALWMKEGMLDANLPMNYTTNFTTFQSRTNDILQQSYGRHVYVGVGAYLLDITNLISQLHYARTQNAQGMILFSYANNNKGTDWLTAFQKLQQEVFPTPALVPEMPWKTTVGHIQGKVIFKNTYEAVYNAEISIPSLGKTQKTDASGCFAFPSLSPGTYSLTCSVKGFSSQELKITVRAGQVTSYVLKLE